jgi:hypothetical protein
MHISCHTLFLSSNDNPSKVKAKISVEQRQTETADEVSGGLALCSRKRQLVVS